MIEDTFSPAYVNSIHMCNTYYVRAECRGQQVQNLILRLVSKNIFFFFVLGHICVFGF